MVTNQVYRLSEYLVDEPTILFPDRNYEDEEVPELLTKLVNVDGVVKVKADLDTIQVFVEDDNVLDEVERILDINQNDWCDLQLLGVRGSEECVSIMEI